MLYTMCVHTEALKQIIVAEVPFKTCSLWIFSPVPLPLRAINGFLKQGKTIINYCLMNSFGFLPSFQKQC